MPVGPLWLGISEDKAATGFKLIEDLEESENNDLANALEDLKINLNATAYIALRAHLNGNGKSFDFMIYAPEMEAFRIIAEKAKWDVRACLKVLDWGVAVHDQRGWHHAAKVSMITMVPQQHRQGCFPPVDEGFRSGQRNAKGSFGLEQLPHSIPAVRSPSRPSRLHRHG